MNVRTKLTAIAVGALLGLVMGCTQQNGADQFSSQGLSPEWKAELEEAAELATSDFERDAIRRALSTGSIADTDYLAAIELYTDCMKSKGYDIKQISQPGTIIKQFKLSHNFSEEQYKADNQACNDGNGLVSAIYTAMLQNPENHDPIQKALECAKEKGVLPDTFSRDELSLLLGEENFSDQLSEADGEILFNCLI